MHKSHNVNNNSNKGILISAIRHWIESNAQTPYMLIKAPTDPQHMFAIRIPKEFIKDGVVVLDVSSKAVVDFEITETRIKFNATFNTKLHIISFPIENLSAIYSKESNRGLIFDNESNKAIIDCSIS